MATLLTLKTGICTVLECWWISSDLRIALEALPHERLSPQVIRTTAGDLVGIDWRSMSLDLQGVKLKELAWAYVAALPAGIVVDVEMVG